MIQIHLNRQFPDCTFCRARVDHHSNLIDVEVTSGKKTHWLIFSQSGQLITNSNDQEDTKSSTHDIHVWIDPAGLPAAILDHLTNHFPAHESVQAVATWSRNVVTKYRVTLDEKGIRHELEFYGQWKLT